MLCLIVKLLQKYVDGLQVMKKMYLMNLQVMNTRYFTCEPRHGVFSRLYRLTCFLFANNKNTDILIKMFPILITGYYVYITG